MNESEYFFSSIDLMQVAGLHKLHSDVYLYSRYYFCHELGGEKCVLFLGHGLTAAISWIEKRVPISCLCISLESNQGFLLNRMPWNATKKKLSEPKVLQKKRC